MMKTLEWFTTKSLNMQNIRSIELSFSFGVFLWVASSMSTSDSTQPWKAFRQMWITACCHMCVWFHRKNEEKRERWKFNQYLFNIHLNLFLYRHK
jgi:hypothetical protein